MIGINSEAYTTNRAMTDVAFDGVTFSIKKRNGALSYFASLRRVAGFGLKFKDDITIFVFTAAEASVRPFFTFELTGILSGLQFFFQFS